MLCHLGGGQGDPLPHRQWAICRSQSCDALLRGKTMYSLLWCNAHFQNGAKCKIRDLLEHTHTTLLYACNKWPGMVMVHLWPYAMRHYNHMANCTPQLGATLSPLELFWALQWLWSDVTYTVLDVLHTFWTMHNNLGKVHTNGSPGHVLVCIWGHHLTTLGQWLLF